MTVSMTKSELIEILTQRQGHLKAEDVDMAVKSLLEMMGGSLANGDRIEIRGFGSFSLHYRPPRTGRNPKTGDRSEEHTSELQSLMRISYAVFCLKKKKKQKDQKNKNLKKSEQRITHRKPITTT